MLSSHPAVVFLMDAFDAGSFEITFEKQSEQILLTWAWTCLLLKSYSRAEKVRERYNMFKYWVFNVLYGGGIFSQKKPVKKGTALL